jgi:hypothetical protein
MAAAIREETMKKLVYNVPTKVCPRHILCGIGSCGGGFCIPVAGEGSPEWGVEIVDTRGVGNIGKAVLRPLTPAAEQRQEDVNHGFFAGLLAGLQAAHGAAWWQYIKDIPVLPGATQSPRIKLDSFGRPILDEDGFLIVYTWQKTLPDMYDKPEYRLAVVGEIPSYLQQLCKDMGLIEE